MKQMSHVGQLEERKPTQQAKKNKRRHCHHLKKMKLIKQAGMMKK
jgi:hypothetical protein